MFGFSADLRIRTRDQFQQVYQRRQRLFSPLFILYQLPNSLSFPRLGVVVSKRNVRFAVNRNVIKRIAKEHFRLKQKVLRQLDIVIVARQEANKATREELHQCIDQLLTQLLTSPSKRSEG